MYEIEAVHAFAVPPAPPRGRTETARTYMFQPDSPFDGLTPDPRPYPQPKGRCPTSPPLVLQFDTGTADHKPSTPPPQGEKARHNSPVNQARTLNDEKDDKSAAESLAALRMNSETTYPQKSKAIDIQIVRPPDFSGELYHDLESPGAESNDPSDHSPVIKQVAFAAGSVIPGNAKAEDKPDHGVRISDKPPAEEEKSEPLDKKRDYAHPVPKDVTDFDMDYVNVDELPDDPPPDLSYPPDSESSDSHGA